MKNIFASFAAVVLLAGAGTAQNKIAAAQTKAAPAQQVAVAETSLTAQLPASDFAATMNLKRILNEVLPQVLAAKPAELNKINQNLDEFKTKYGFDVRQFEEAAMSASYKPGANGAASIEPVVVARGSFNPLALIGAAKVAVNGKFRQETIAGKNVVFIQIPEAAARAAQTRAGNGSGDVDQLFENIFKGEFAIVALDGKTIAAGKPAQVRSLLAATTASAKLDKDSADYLNRKSAAVMNFAFKLPADMIKMLGASNPGNDQIGNVIKSLRQVNGSVDTNGSDASVSLAARTTAEQQATELEELLQMVKTFGGGMLGGKTDAKNQALARLVQNTTITRTANEVQIDAIVPSDVFKLLLGDQPQQPAATTTTPQ